MPSVGILLAAALIVVWYVFEQKRYSLLVKAIQLTEQMPAPYDIIATWYLKFDVNALPENKKADGRRILGYRREREITSLARGLVMIALMILTLFGYPWIHEILRSYGLA
jgi:hypothetical protein